jgi:hypothetical protein
MFMCATVWPLYFDKILKTDCDSDQNRDQIQMSGRSFRRPSGQKVKFRDLLCCNIQERLCTECVLVPK